jgi:hypothetical protein
MGQNETALTAGPAPDLQLVDREQLRLLLKPSMTPASFNNWLTRAQRDRGFPEPIRTGTRAWHLLEVRIWLQGRPRKGVFTGRRRVLDPSGAAA